MYEVKAQALRWKLLAPRIIISLFHNTLDGKVGHGQRLSRFRLEAWRRMLLHR